MKKIAIAAAAAAAGFTVSPWLVLVRPVADAVIVGVPATVSA